MRIAVLGYVGSGKTYVSNYISERKSISCLHLDSVKYDKEWKPIDNSIILPQVEEFMEKRSWIIEGSCRELLIDERLEKADKIVILLLPRTICLLRVLKRKREREQEGYKSDLNWWFLKFTLFGCRNKKRRRFYAEITKKYEEKTFVLKTRKQVNEFIQSIAGQI